jgi:hypothetical protein
MTRKLPGWASPLISECRSAGEDADLALKLAADYGKLLTAVLASQPIKSAA